MANPVTHYQTSLTVAMTASQLMMSVNSIETKDTPPHTLTMADFGAIFYAVIEPGSASEEVVSFTGITDNLDGSGIFTGLVRGLAYYGATDIIVPGNAKAHASNVTVIISNVKNVYALYTSREDNETITGTWTFTNPDYPRMDTAVPPPTDDEQLVTKKYVDDLVIAGAPDATTTTKGISKLSVAAVLVTNPIVVGDNDPRVPTQGENDALVGDNTDIPVGTGNTFVTQTGLQKSAEMYDVSTGAYTPAFLTGDTGAESVVANWAVLPNASFRISVDGVFHNVDAINFTTTPPVTMNDVAAIIQAKLRLATGSTETVVWVTNHFVITSADTTASSAITVTSTSTGVVGTDISGAGGSDWMDADATNGVVTNAVNNAYVVTLSPAPTSYAAGMTVRFQAVSANTGAVTLNVNGLGAKNLTKNGAIALEANDIKINQVITAVYDGTQFQIQSLSVMSQAEADALIAGPVNADAGSFAYVRLDDGTNFNSDLTITTGFLPSIIELQYYIQGHGSSTGSAAYEARVGTVVYKAAVQQGDYRIYANTTSGDNAAVTIGVTDPTDLTSTTSPQAGTDIQGGGDGAVRMVLSVLSVSSTGFIIRRRSESTPSGVHYNARATAIWKAFR